MDYLEFLYIESLVSIGLLGDHKWNVSIRKLAALQSIYIRFRQFAERNMIDSLVTIAFEKKLEHLQAAKTIAEVEKIEKPSTPRLYGGELISNGQYHIEEEELLIWAIVSPHIKFANYAENRYMALFKKHLPELYKKVFRKRKPNEKIST